MTLLVRDEVDIIEANLAFHLARGVDRVLVTDHRSVDGTSDVLARFARSGRVHVHREEAERIEQAEWTTRMVRRAFEEFGADWVLASDADEFWWPAGGSLEAILMTVPPRVGAIRIIQRTLLPRVERTGAFAERMTVRLSAPSPVVDPGTPFKPVSKIAVRGSSSVVMRTGNHEAAGFDGAMLDGWPGIEILHLPLRSAEQCSRKYANTSEAWERNLRSDVARARMLSAEERGSEFWDRVALDDAIVGRGLSQGTLVVDTRLRDALRSLSALPPAVGVSETVRSADRCMIACDLATFHQTDLTRLAKRLDEVDVRTQRLERTCVGVGRRLAGFARSSRFVRGPV